MQIQTVCPQCGSQYDIDEKFEGVKVQCENCGRQFSAARMPANRGNAHKGRLSMSSCLLIWLMFFAVQGVGYFVAMLLNMVVDAFMINYMVDASIIFDILKCGITFVLTVGASICAFKFIVVKMIEKKLKVE